MNTIQKHNRIYNERLKEIVKCSLYVRDYIEAFVIKLPDDAMPLV